MSHDTEYLEKLTGMANQIVQNLEFGKLEEKLQAEVYSHIKRFWTPMMYQAIIENIDALRDQLHPVAIKVFEQLRNT